MNSNQLPLVMTEQSNKLLGELAERYQALFTQTTGNSDEQFVTITMPLTELNNFSSHIYD